MKRIDLEVTQDIIDNSVKRNSGHCVIADAVRAAVPEAVRVTVDLQTVRFSLPSTGKRYTYLTPSSAHHVLVDFDQGIEPRPQQIRLNRPMQIVPIDSRGRTGPRKTRSVRSTGNTPHTIVEGGTPVPLAALADPPRATHVVDNDGKRRVYAGQRRVFGLRLLRE